MTRRARLAPRTRLLATLACAALCGALALAGRLAPDPRGYGTHEQWGWSPCGFRAWTGMPCPACGATTAWAYAVRGEFRNAAVANLGGLASCVAAAVGAAWAGATAIRGAWPGRRPVATDGLWLGGALVAVTLIDWARRLAVG